MSDDGFVCEGYDRIQKGRPASKNSEQEKQDSARLVVVLVGRAAANIITDHRENMSVTVISLGASFSSSLSLRSFFVTPLFIPGFMTTNTAHGRC